MAPTYDVPPALPQLLETWAEQRQGAVRFRPASWRASLAGVDPLVLQVLCDPALTRPSARIEGDRTVDRETIYDLLAQADLDDELEVLRSFLLVQAWGAGTSGSRTLRHTATAFAVRDRLVGTLKSAATALRKNEDPDVLAVAYDAWMCPGVGPSFFTKWFAFAGRRQGRSWQPLILDVRVYRALNRSLDIRLVDLAGNSARSARYKTYVEATHAWGKTLRVPAERIEFCLFCDNGSSRS